MDGNLILLWVGFNVFVLALLAFDLGILHKNSREIGFREALVLSCGYIALAFAFAYGIYHYMGRGPAVEFLTGYLVEKSLSLDNIFVILLIFTHFKVPAPFQHRVLFFGIIGALVMRAALIIAGVALIEMFSWVVYIFGGFLILTGVKMLLAIDAEPDFENNKILKVARRYLRVTKDFVGDRFFVRQDGLLYVTPLFLVLMLVEAADLIFAVDSIPAIFAITRDPFIVYTSNVFAILGLRALYFALAGIITRFHYLKYALSFVLVLIGTKMILNALAGYKVVPTEWALLATAVLIGGSIAVSLLRPAKSPPPGTWVPGSSSVTRRGDEGDQGGKHNAVSN